MKLHGQASPRPPAWTLFHLIEPYVGITRHEQGWSKGVAGKVPQKCGARVTSIPGWGPIATRAASHLSRGERDVAARTFICPSLRLSSTHIYHTSGVGGPLTAPFVTQGHWVSARLLARLNPAAVLAPTSGVVKHQREPLSSFNARSKLPSSGNCAPISRTAIQRQSTPPLVFPAAELFEKSNWFKNAAKR